MSRAGSADDLGWAWVRHLSAGGTTPWVAFAAAPEPAPSSPALPRPSEALTWLPGAQQLELLRQLNLAGQPSAELVSQVLRGDLPMRGPLDLDLLGLGEHGVDPVEVLERELVRVAVGILARRAVRLGVPVRRAPKSTPTRAARAARRIWRLAGGRPVRLAGDPVLVGAVRRHLIARGRGPLPKARSRQPVLVVGTDLERMLFDAWWHRVLQRGAPGWEQWQRGLVARDRLPRSVDLAQIARRWAERGVEVRVVLDPAAAGRATSTRQLRVPPPPDPMVAELTRLIGAVLSVEVEPHERTRLLRRRVVPSLIRCAPAAPPVQQTAPPSAVHRLLPPVRDWAADQQERLVQQLTRGGYPVTGEVTSLAPARSVEVEGENARALLRLAVAALLDEGAALRDPAPGGAT